MSVDIQGAGKAKRVPESQQIVLDIVRGGQMAGARDMTCSEIQRIWESKISDRVRDGTASGAVSKLKAAGYLCAREEKRQCLVTGETVIAVYVPERQGSLVP